MPSAGSRCNLGLKAGAAPFLLKKSTYNQDIEVGYAEFQPAIRKLCVTTGKNHPLEPFVREVLGAEIADDWSLLHTVGSGLCGFNAASFAFNDVPQLSLPVHWIATKYSSLEGNPKVLGNVQDFS